MNFDELIKKRRSVRHYTNEIVPVDLLIKLIDTSTFAPVSCNLQTTQYIILNEQSVLDVLSKKVSNKFNYSKTHILVLNDSRFLSSRYSGVMSAGMATENIVLKATELGLSACVMAGFERDNETRKTLAIPDYMDILLLISVGFEDKNFYKHNIPKIGLKERFGINSYNGLKTINDSLDLSYHSVGSVIDYRRRIAPVYLDSFRLNSYNNKYYDVAFSCFLENIIKEQKNLNILDLMSYDGLFLKSLFDNKLNINNKITCSDYLENNINFFKNKFGIEALVINDENKFDSELSGVDVATFIFGFSFTPKLDVLLCELKKAMKDEAILFVADVSQSLFNLTFKKIQNIYTKFILKQNVNIYENNPFYKIGPRTYFSKNKIISLCESCGFRLENKVITKKQGNGISLNILVFKKVK